jgi:hypothetical protein
MAARQTGQLSRSSRGNGWFIRPPRLDWHPTPSSWVMPSIDSAEVVNRRLSTLWTPRQTHRVESRGYCIYCGAEPPVDLTEDHALPLGFTGNLVVPASSCKPCAAITNSFEQYCMRETFGDIRAHLGLSSGRKHKKGERAHQFIVRRPRGDGTNEERIVAQDEHPPVLSMLVLTPPRVMRMLPKIGAAELARPGIHRVADTRAEERFQRLDPDWEVRFDFNPLHYCLMLAKIAHTYACGMLGHGRFVPVLADVIRNKSSDVFWYVGGDGTIPPRNQQIQIPAGFNYAHSLGRMRVRQGPHGPLLTVDVCLFVLMGGPNYRVVVGPALRGCNDIPELFKSDVTIAISQPAILPKPASNEAA